MPADSWPRREPHESERLRGSCVDHRPYVESEAVTVDRQLVDQGNIDVTERVFQQLGKLGLPGFRHRHGAFDQPTIEVLQSLQRFLVHACDDLWSVAKAPDLV